MAPNPADSDNAETLRRITATHAESCGCFFDFDGTLAKIQDDPETVSPVPGAVAALKELSGHVKRVAIVSARPAGFLREQFADLPEIALFGLYGLESQFGSEEVHTHPDAAPYEQVMARVADQARAELPETVLVEYKRLSVALHYRRAPQTRALIEEWAQRRTAELGLRAQPGRMVVELKPPGARDKGTVVAEQVSDLSCAWYFGDDLSDLRAFAALDERGAADPAFVGVRVAVANAESGDELVPAADLHVEGPDQVPDFLATLIGALRD